jgi:two-component system, LytTR family, response regulator
MTALAPIRTLIVDDEAPARSRLRHLLKGETDFEIAGEAANGRQALEAIRGLKPDLVLLDVQMPGLNGLQVCAELGAHEMPAVVFVTAYDRFALQAFEVHAVDYLLKPIDRDRFQKTLRHLRARLSGARTASEVNPQLLSLIAELREGRRGSERLAIKVDGRVLFVRTAEIDWLEAEGNYVRLHVGAANHLFRETLSSLETDLPPGRFLRISRSVIVNLDAVKELQPLFYGDYAVVLRDGQQLTLSRTYRDRIEQLLERRG